MQPAPVIVLISYQTKPGMATIALAELKALIAAVVATESACHRITLHQSDTDDTRILLYEQWADKKAFTGPHMQTPHLKAFVAKARGFLASPPDISYWGIQTEEAKANS